nr:autotransporter outer membrane beta-barrel domain-containing protein [Pantoea sp. AMG 501]
MWQFDGANAAWRAGIFGAIGTMHSDVWRDRGSKSAGTDSDRVYTGGAYLSGLTHGGLSVNGLVQASQHNLKVASKDNTSLSTTGKGWLVSAEVGRASEITPCLALEPQLQYTLQLMKETSCGFSTALVSTIFATILVADPGALIPIFYLSGY